MSFSYHINYFPIGVFIYAENSDSGDYDIVYSYYTKYVMPRSREVADIRIIDSMIESQ